MKTNQLPPELVEKFKSVNKEFAFESIPNIRIQSEQCAQIAVDYARDIQTVANNLSADQIKLIKQRDELLEALKESQLQLEYLSKKFGETGTGNSVISRNNQLIQKYDVKHD